MADVNDLPSDSDDSDVDFKPSDAESLPSEEDSDGSVEEPAFENEDEQQNTSTGKRKKKPIKRRKKIKRKNTSSDDETTDNEKTKEDIKLSAEDEKKKTDSLWNDFMKDCTSPVQKTSSVTDLPTDIKESKIHSSKKLVTQKENNAVVTEIFEFAGEKIKVEKEVPVQASGRGRGVLTTGRGRGRGASGGLASVLGQLGKKNKLSTLEKSKLDWEKFKKDQGIQEDILTHNKGKYGFLDKQDFLQRTDLRQFEIEKQLRTTSRSNR